MSFAHLRTAGRVAMLSAAGLLAGLASFASERTEARAAADEAAVREAAARSTGIISTIDVTQRPLKDVLQYLSRVGGQNIIPARDEVGEMLVTVKLDNVFWRDALDIIAEKYKLSIDTTKARSRVLVVDAPPKVTATFQNTEIKAAIQLICDWGNANIVISPKVTGSVSGKLQDVPWREALEIILKANQPMLVLVEEKHGVLRVASPDELQAQLDTKIFTLSYIQPATTQYRATINSPYLEKSGSGAKGAAGTEATSLLTVLEKVKSSNGQIAYEKRTNSIIVTDTAAKLETIQKMIEKLDVAPKQIHLSMKLVELSDVDSDKLGMQWNTEKGMTFAYSGPKFGTFFPFELSTNATNGLIDTPLENVVPGINPTNQPARLTRGGALSSTSGATLSYGSLDFSGLQMALDLIRTQTSGKVIQSPQIIALDNEEATIHVGRRVRFAEQFVTTTEGGGAASGFQEASKSPVELGIQVLVIPHVTGNDNNVILTIVPKTEDFTDPSNPFVEFVGAGITLKLPQTSQRIVVTKMMLRNGETGVIAGLREERTGATVSKIPFFGDIPILGWLFKHKSYTKDAKNLIIFVTPTIVDFARREELDERVKGIQEGLGRPFGVFEEESPAPAPAAAPPPAATEIR